MLLLGLLREIIQSLPSMFRLKATYDIYARTIMARRSIELKTHLSNLDELSDPSATHTTHPSTSTGSVWCIVRKELEVARGLRVGRQHRGVLGPSAGHFGGAAAADAGALRAAPWRASGGGLLQREVKQCTLRLSSPLPRQWQWHCVRRDSDELKTIVGCTFICRARPPFVVSGLLSQPRDSGSHST